MNSFVDQLVKAGLTAIQARVYISVLQIGPSPASDIAKHANVNRVTTYSALEELTQMNLVVQDDHGAVKTFQTLAVENLDKVFMERAQNAIQAYRHIQSLIPDLRTVATKPLLYPTILHYDGQVAIEEYFAHLPGHLQMQSAYIKDEDHFEFIRDLVKRSADRDVRPKAIIPHSLKPALLVYLDFRVIPAKLAQFPATTLLLNDRVLMLFAHESFIQCTAFLDERIVQQFKLLFDLNWRIISGEHLLIAEEHE